MSVVAVALLKKNDRRVTVPLPWQQDLSSADPCQRSCSGCGVAVSLTKQALQCRLFLRRESGFIHDFSPGQAYCRQGQGLVEQADIGRLLGVIVFFFKQKTAYEMDG